MPDASTGSSTDGAGVVTTTSTTPSASVTPAQTTLTTQQQQPAQQILDTSAMIAQYEQRLRNLMSDKDKAINERNTAISAQTSLQEQLTTLQEQTSGSLTATANAAQTAINRSKQLEAQISTLQGEALRAQTLLEKPHLAPYAQFIPASSDPDAVKKAVDQLEQIRASDLERNRAVGQFQGGLPTLPGTPGQPVPSTLPNGQPNVAALYANRANLPISLSTMPGSTPAQMSPTGITDPTAEINRILTEARASGDAQTFERAVQQAAVLSQTVINQQLGRSS